MRCSSPATSRSRGKPVQYHLADEWLDAVADVLGISREKVLVCPGNHDVDRALIAEEHRGHREDLERAADNLLDQAVDKLLAAEGRSVLDPLRSYSEFAAGRQCGLDRSRAGRRRFPSAMATCSRSEGQPA